MPGGKAVRKIGSREITRYRLRIKIYIKLVTIRVHIIYIIYVTLLEIKDVDILDTYWKFR